MVLLLRELLLLSSAAAVSSGPPPREKKPLLSSRVRSTCAPSSTFIEERSFAPLVNCGNGML